MPSGGHARSGPAPERDALRRNRPSDQAGWVRLSPRTGPAPAWPLSKASARELELWNEEWQRPQAVMWERLELAREVAFYVRCMKVAEMPKASTSQRTLVRQAMDSLGITVSGLARHRWIIVPAESEATSAPVRNDDPARESPEARLARIKGTVLDGGRTA